MTDRETPTGVVAEGTIHVVVLATISLNRQPRRPGTPVHRVSDPSWFARIRDPDFAIPPDEGVVEGRIQGIHGGLAVI